MTECGRRLLSIFAGLSFAGPRLTDEQWNCVAKVLGDDCSPHWRPAIDSILAIVAHAQELEIQQELWRRQKVLTLEKIANISRTKWRLPWEISVQISH
jgi:hypothetical protein